MRDIEGEREKERETEREKGEREGERGRAEREREGVEMERKGKREIEYTLFFFDNNALFPYIALAIYYNSHHASNYNIAVLLQPV